LHVLGHDDVVTGQAETVCTACYSALLLAAIRKKKILLSQSVAPVAAKQRGVGLHISYIRYYLSDW
jgi:hypothetical protein